MKAKRIKNIISESAKLAIRDYMDNLTEKSNETMGGICSLIVENYWNQVESYGRDIEKIILLKNKVLKLSQDVKTANKEQIINVLER